MVACIQGLGANVQVLLSEPGPARHGVQDSEGMTALHYAAQGGHRDCVEALVRAGAAKDVKNAAGQVPVQLTKSPAVADMIQVLIKEDQGGAAAPVAPVEVKDEHFQACDSSARSAVQALMEQTWKDVTTRDRGYTDVNKFQVIHVWENLRKDQFMEAYSQRKENVKLSLVNRLEDIKTNIPEWEAFLASKGVELDKKANECYLFHGTNVKAMRPICESNFKVNLSGSNKGTLYGPGIYLGENSSKADEYAMDSKDDMSMGNFGMLLCRVVLGNPVMSEDVAPKLDELQAALDCEAHHCILGDREKARGTYREFIVQNVAQVIPEYAVVYARR
jgi:hypothetical protein